jgi:serine/threonine protein kinase
LTLYATIGRRNNWTAALASDQPQTISQALPSGHLLKEYSLLSVLGMGGFGITYLAADNYLHLKVAIKEYFPSSAAVRNQFSGSIALKSEQAQAEYAWGKERFMREAQTLARFSHKNIVQVFRYFEANGTCYMVMPYEEGMSLEQALSGDPGRWNEQSVLALLMPLLDGLESVHEAGFLHRDIKPANIVLRAKDDSPVLIDFGAARSPTATEALTVVLSHGYGPPEQYSRQSHQGPWTDIYAMAGVLYRIVAGVVPPISLHRIKSDAMIPATFSGEGRFSADFLGAIDLALNVEETKRPQSVGEWRALLTRGASGRASLSAPVSPIARSEIDSKLPAATDGSPNQRPDKAAQPARPRPTLQMEEVPEPGLLARIGQAMIAHPFLTLFLLLASLFIALFQFRRPASTQPPNQPGAPVTATEARNRPGVSQPMSADVQNPPSDGPASRENPNDGARSRGPFLAAVNACTGKPAGASCFFIVRGNESINGTCAIPPDGPLICRPQRVGERRNELPDSVSRRQDTRQYPTNAPPPR